MLIPSAIEALFRSTGPRRLVRATCLCLALGVLASPSAGAQIIQKSSQNPGTKQSANITINVTFQSVSAERYVMLKYGAVVLKTTLAGIKLKPGAAGVLAALLPNGVRLEAEIVSKGKIQSVILRNRGVNINEQLLIQGVAESAR